MMKSTVQVFFARRFFFNFTLCCSFLHFFIIVIKFLNIFRGINLPGVKFAENEFQIAIIENWGSSLSLLSIIV